MADVIKHFFAAFSGTAVTARDLLWVLALSLAGQNDASSHGNSHCGGRGLKTSQPLKRVSSGKSNSGNESRDCDAASCWMSRLEAWLEEPGVQIVELHQQVKTHGLHVKARLLPNQLPGQVRCHVATLADAIQCALAMG